MFRRGKASKMANVSESSEFSESPEFSGFSSFVGKYQILLYFNCGFTISLYPLIYYLIYSTPVKLNGVYKFMLFHCATTSLLNSILFCFWAPAFIPETFGVVITGIFKSFDTSANLPCLQGTLILVVNSHLCTVLLLGFQVSSLRTTSIWRKLCRTGTRMLLMYFSVMVLQVALVWILLPKILNSWSSSGETSSHNETTSFVQELSTRNLTFLSFTSVNTRTFTIFGIMQICIFLFLFLIAFWCISVLLKVIHSNFGTFTTPKYRQETMMFRVFVFKIATLFVVFWLPMLIYCCSILLKLHPSPLLGMVCNLIAASHGWISYIGTMALIAPFRRVIIGLIFRRKIKDVYTTPYIMPSASLTETTGTGEFTDFKQIRSVIGL